MFILDTNVVSELFRPRPDPAVEHWFEAADPAQLYVTSISKAESLLGLALMPDGRRKQILGSALRTFFEDRLRTPVLAFGDREAEHFAELVSHRLSIGRQIGEFDAQIAAIARRHDCAVVTRNTDDFQECGIEVINPWLTAV
jgi:predicted nucleic acid-binding protein